MSPLPRQSTRNHSNHRPDRIIYSNGRLTRGAVDLDWHGARGDELAGLPETDRLLMSLQHRELGATGRQLLQTKDNRCGQDRVCRPV